MVKSFLIHMIHDRQASKSHNQARPCGPLNMAVKEISPWLASLAQPTSLVEVSVPPHP